MNNGITVLQVKEMFGLKGEQAALDLIEDGLIHLVENKYIAKTEFINHSFSSRFTQKLASELITEFYKNDSNINFISHLSNSVSVSGYNQIINKLKSTSIEIQKMIEQMPGEIPISSVISVDTMTYANIFKKSESN